MIKRAVIKTVSGKTVLMKPVSLPVAVEQIRRALAQHHTIISSEVCGKDDGTFKAIVADPETSVEEVTS